MYNPLANLCQQLGLSEQAIGSLLNRPESLIHDMLSDQPKELLASYLHLMAALGVKMRLVADAPLRLWFDLGAIDALVTSSEFRCSQGLEPMPANRGELRKLIRRLHRKHMSYSQIVRFLEANCIPTATGVQNWRRSTIGQHLNLRVSGEDDAIPLEIGPEFREAFRGFVRSHLLVAIFPFDPFASVRHQVLHWETEGRLCIESAGPLPASIRQWVKAAVEKLGWFKPGDWGEGNDEVQGQLVAGAQGESTNPLPAGNGSEAQANQGGGAPALDQHRPSHHSDDLPRPDGRRGETDPTAAGGD